jgi:hypothetical protein
MNSTDVFIQHQDFINNKYYTWYFNIINKRLKTPVLDEYCENHHIIPSGIGGPDNISNRVKLTSREHFICHLLLTKFCIGDSYFKMVNAFESMFIKTKKMSNRYVNSYFYEYRRKIASEKMKALWQDPDFIEKMKNRPHGNNSKSLKKVWDDPTHKKEILYKRKLDRLANPEKYSHNTTNGRKIMHKGPNEKFIIPEKINEYLKKGWAFGRSQNTKNKVSKSSQNKIYKIWITNGTDSKLIEPKYLKNYQGWVKGKHHSKGKTWVKNATSNKLISTNELNKYLQIGWVKGKHSKKGSQ